VSALDTSSLTWTARTPMPTARSFPGTVTAPDDRIYAIGGYDSLPASLASVEVYTPERDRWTTAAPITTPRGASATTIGPDGRIYIAGGWDNTNPLSSVEVYGPTLAVGSQLAPGSAATVTAANFATNAPIAISIDDQPIASGVTDGAGAASIQFVVPVLVPGN